jgi:uracil phosphoribosyltransferase
VSLSASAAPPRGGHLAHAYGPQVTLLDDAFCNSALARLSQPNTPHAEVVAALRAVYQRLGTEALGTELPRVNASVETRMAAVDPATGVWSGEVLDPEVPVVVLDIMRGGIIPSQTLFEQLTLALPLESLRLDHLEMARVSDAEGHVAGVDLRAAKVGGSTEGAVLVIPDPMGATGSTVRQAVEWIRAHHGRPRLVLALHLIVTPEAVRTAVELGPEVRLWAARLDRGLSSAAALAEAPGTLWDEERGLNEHGYIVPGAGGVGEVLNNSWC